jgi:hypothetical protein
MRRLIAILMALMMLSLAPCARAEHYGWAFVIYDLGMSIEIDNSFTRTDDATLEQTNSFERSGNVKPDLIMELYNPDTRSQLFVYCAPISPYDNLDELTQAYAEDLGATVDSPDENGTAWQILTGQEFCGAPCARILSSFQNVNAEYILMLSEDHSAYIITMITFDDQAPESALAGITFRAYGTGSDDGTDAAADAQPTAQPTAEPTSLIQGLIGSAAGN